jgi:hypothetical protein
MNGKNCGLNCKYFHGYCETDCNGGLKFVEFCEKNNDKFLEFNQKYGNKNSAVGIPTVKWTGPLPN